MDIDDRIFDKDYVLVEFAHFIQTTIHTLYYLPKKMSDFIISHIGILLD